MAPVSDDTGVAFSYLTIDVLGELNPMSDKTKDRISFGKVKELLPLPNLIEIQTKSFDEFLQSNTPPENRKDIGLQTVFKELFPVLSYDESIHLDYTGYSFGVPKYNIEECKRRGLTYAASLKVQLRLKENNSVKEETVYFGNIPLMTREGTFIINGAERVIVSQLHRSPGIYFEEEINPRGIQIFSFRVIPYRGSWLEAQFDSNRLIYIYVDRKKRRRKILATTFLRALGYGTNEEILDLFGGREEINISKKLDASELVGKLLGEDVIEPETEVIVGKVSQPITKAMVKKFEEMKLKKISILKIVDEEHPILKMLKKDTTDSQESALKDIYKKLRPGDPATIANARALIKRLFFDVKRYDLGRVGRYKIHQKLGLELSQKDLDITTLAKEDIVNSLRYLINLLNGEGTVDDIDHLGNRRVRSVGELLQAQCRVGLARMEKLIKDRMNLYDMSAETLSPHKLVNPKSFSSIIRDFFGRSQLSQFMDQTNALSELTHKRRLSALGPGGLSRERAGFEVRDVHPSHYGRICPIETPEGPNIGLIASLSTYARVNDFGFLETPYSRVENGRVTEQIDYLTADDEEKYIVAQANAAIDDKGNFTDPQVSVRYRGDFLLVSKEQIHYMDISPKQLVSVAAGLIPFLEHDDANRALMGSNMQRQAVPLLTPQAPYVATGMERRAAIDSGIMVVADETGTVLSSDANRIIVKEKNKTREYFLKKNSRSNSGTSINQRPIVLAGEKITKGQVLADGPATDNGELALGRNILVAFMSWGGYNFEDAILISEKLVKDDAFTSIHVDEFEIGARDTKLGREEITRDIPNVGEDALKDLGEDGVIRIGAEVKPGDILVGKITPKSETELSPEERLLRAIFGEKAADVRDASLTVPSGSEGIVMDVKVFARKEKAKTESDKLEERRRMREINAEFKEKMQMAIDEKSGLISDLLLDKTSSSDIVNSKTGEVIIKANKKITGGMVEKFEAIDPKYIEMEESALRTKIKRIFMDFEHAVEEVETVQNLNVEKLKKGDELDPGVIKQVKVYVASKRKLSVGDKMAGRHGNKGVIAKILPEEDMPYLPDGTPVQMVLNPLGVPSRMNVGQILEIHLGWAAHVLGMKFATPVFDGISEKKIKELLVEANLPVSGKSQLYDGRTGEAFDQEVTVGHLYMLKLSHLVADKIHARAVGPYSLVTQQPLGGKAQYGGQRFGEMEVWALEAYGAAHTLQELLTVKSDDVQGRTRIYESIVKGDNSLQAGTPESFNVLIKEMQSLGLDVRVHKASDNNES